MSTFNPRKFKAIIDEVGMDDLGMSGITFEVKSLTKGKIYKESDPKYLSNNKTDVVIDDNSCWWYIGTNEFNKRFIEIKD